ncbi:Na+/H+ antiporter subunit E [Paenibacillus sp. 1P07SE]|uniref:Na+/H+ antiporter subunit E n=1 Tax=Paenibacillus sp. 1P07SE TaxID=3132209 RepID=UPI0039A4F419
MLYQIVLNLGIAAAWMLLRNSFTFGDALMGFLAGLLVALLVARWRGHKMYTSRVWAAWLLLVVLIREIAIANWVVMKIVLRPKLNITPAILEVPTRLESSLERALFAACITLTPGSLSMEFSREGDRIFVHYLDVQDREAAIIEVKNTFERRIMEVTRGHA